MQPMSDGYFDIMDLAKDLRSEKLFIESELESVRQLNERLERCALELAQASWTNTQQRCNLKQIVAQGDYATASCCHRTDYVLSPVFVDAHKVLRYQDSLVLSEVIGRIRSCPGVASAWLVAAECGQSVSKVARALTSGVYAGDCRPVRHILTYLAKHRLATADDPRRVISIGNSSFSKLYCELVEGFRPARIFLNAALKPPLLPLLQLDEYLLVDPDKAMDRVKKYCSPAGSASEYQQKLVKYRKWTITCLATATKRFIASLVEHWVCFPPTIAWVVRHTAMALKESGRVSQEDIHAICTDLVFTNFICPAIMNPEAYGITDIPITNIGRFNLIQVAQTLQVLCLLKHQEVDSKLRDLYSRLEKESVYSLIDVLLEDENYSAVPDDHSSREEKRYSEDAGMILERDECDSLDELDDSIKTDSVVNANVALFTRDDLQILVSLLKRFSSNQCNGFDHSSLEQSFDQLRITTEMCINKADITSTVSVDRSNDVDPYSEINGDSACGVTPEEVPGHGTPANRIQDWQDRELSRILRTVHPEQISRLQALLKRLSENSFVKESEKMKTLPKSKNSSSGNSAASSPARKKNSSVTSISNNIGGKTEADPANREVLMIKLQCDASYEPIGVVSESKVLEWYYSNLTVHRTGLPLPVVPLLEENGSAAVEDLGSLQAQGVQKECVEVEGTNRVIGVGVVGNQHRGQEKRTRFSLSHDEGSIGNTSDNLEAASNHSVTSSLEMETEDQNDNLSDMVSANVSGRGSPNISGRDTPSSQVTEGDNPAPGLPMPPPHRLPPNVPLNPSSASKQAKLVKRVRNNIEDKFCKFEIKKLLEGDETVSIISDTWSTDVLASDSETIGESTYERNIVTPHHSILAGGGVVNGIPPVQPDASETASESAWSTDALVSDSDRLTEVDIDECSSVGRLELSSGLDGGTPMHHQFSPHNNIKRDALLNTRQQMSAALVHEAHPDNISLPSSPRLVASGSSSAIAEGIDPTESIAEEVNKNLPPNDVGSDSSSNASGGLGAAMVSVAPSLLSAHQPFPGDVVLRKSLNGQPSSLYTEMSSSSDSSNEGTGATSCLAAFISDNVIGVVSPHPGLSGSGDLISNGISLQSRRPKAYHEHVVPPEALGEMTYDRGASGDNGYHIRVGAEYPLPILKPSLPPESPGAQLEGYPLPLPAVHRPVMDNVNLFDFDLQDSNRMSGGGLNSQALESGISTPEGMFHSSTSPFVPPTNNSATSRWLNDPCQKFPSARHECTSTPSKMCNKRSTSQEDVSVAESNLGDMKRSNTDSMFRPINITDSNLSDIDDSGISDLNGCVTMPFLNGTDDVSKQEFSNTISTEVSFSASSNGFVEHYQENHTGSYKLSSTESFSSSTITADSKVLHLNGNTSEIVKMNSPTKGGMTDMIKRSFQSGSPVSRNAMLNSLDSNAHSEKRSGTLESNSEQRGAPSLGSCKGDKNAATFPRNSTPYTSAKPNSSTGAIPKSISFDSTAEKNHRHQHRRINQSNSVAATSGLGHDTEVADSGALNFGDIKNNMKRSGGQILNKIKSFKNKSRGLAASAAGFGRRANSQGYSPDQDSTDSMTTNVKGAREDSNKPTYDLSEDILAKYRRKASSSSSEAASSDAGVQQWPGAVGEVVSAGISTGNSNNQQTIHSNGLNPDDMTNVSDVESAIQSDVAMDVESDVLKKKLRQALSNLDLHSIELSAGRDGGVSLMCALRLAGDSYLSAALHSPEFATAPPLQALRRDSRARRPYLAYLARCRRSLIYNISRIQSEIEWHQSEALRQAGLVAAGRALVSLAGREGCLASLQERLRSGLSDEKRDLLIQTLASLNSEMARDEAWTGVSEWELEQAALTVERTIMSRVYLQAMFPNGDGDILRDQLLREHIIRLSACQAGIPPFGTGSGMWIPALRQLAQLPAYKAPLDKVRCIQSCVHTIVALLSALSENPGADHLTPSLVYLIIKVNPQSLLSTIQYVNTFVSSPLEGELLYCWTQFCSAVEFIKTMDYTRR